MKRVFLTLSYDGTAYAGWQRQKNALSVQQVLEEALTRLTCERISVTGASRTDAGVHALGQAAHFDTCCNIPPEKFSFALNTVLPGDIRILSGHEATFDFHARFDACAKTYHYVFHNAPHVNALSRLYHAHIPLPLNVARMRDAARVLLGRHDFSAFRGSGGALGNTAREITEIDVIREAETVTVVVTGNAFLYHMVRIIAGTLAAIGQGKLPLSCLQEALCTGDRLVLGATAPAHGLCLMRVYYPNQTAPDTCGHRLRND